MSDKWIQEQMRAARKRVRSRWGAAYNMLGTELRDALLAREILGVVAAQAMLDPEHVASDAQRAACGIDVATLAGCALQSMGGSR